MQHLRSTISRPGKRHLAGVGLVCLLVLACDPLGLDSTSRTRVQGTPRKVTPTWTVRSAAEQSSTPTPTTIPTERAAAPFERALRRCAEDRFGLHPDYRESAILDASVLPSLGIPAERYPQVLPPDNVQAIYGISIDGGVTVAQLAPGQIADKEQEPDMPFGCYLQFISVHGTYSDAGSALDLLLDTFAGAPRDREGYQATRTAHGYAFIHGAPDGNGTTERQPSTLRLEAYRAEEGTLILSALSEATR